MDADPTSNQRLECNACDWKGPRSEAVHFKHDASVLLCPECKETTVQSTPLSSNGMTIQLENVARWLENKCDPFHAARELRLLVEQMRSVETSADMLDTAQRAALEAQQHAIAMGNKALVLTEALQKIRALTCAAGYDSGDSEVEGIAQAALGSSVEPSRDDDMRAAFRAWFNEKFIPGAPEGNVWMAWQAAVAWHQGAEATAYTEEAQEIRESVQRQKASGSQDTKGQPISEGEKRWHLDPPV